MSIFTLDNLAMLTTTAASVAALHHHQQHALGALFASVGCEYKGTSEKPVRHPAGYKALKGRKAPRPALYVVPVPAEARNFQALVAIVGRKKADQMTGRRAEVPGQRKSAGLTVVQALEHARQQFKGYSFGRAPLAQAA